MQYFGVEEHTSRDFNELTWGTSGSIHSWHSLVSCKGMDFVMLKHLCCCYCCCCSFSSFIFFSSSLITSFIEIRYFKIFTHLLCIVSISRSTVYNAFFKGHKNTYMVVRCTPLENMNFFYFINADTLWPHNVSQLPHDLDHVRNFTHIIVLHPLLDYRPYPYHPWLQMRTL